MSFASAWMKKQKKMNSNNFHLLRHLGWQVKNIGTLFVTSAAMFESANRLLIAPLIGTVNHCQLFVQRFIRAKLIQIMEIENDCLSAMMVKFGAPKEFDDCSSLPEFTEIKDFPITESFVETEENSFCLRLRERFVSWSFRCNRAGKNFGGRNSFFLQSSRENGSFEAISQTEED